ncbi:MAG: NAD(+)/NADH kinase [Acidimicrobiales bacterium]|nr:NAD(+)/NADH kinase [Acidimicrobiales bacterium]MCB1017524.1 NAD(+)/NADH kinase [Acidimicrobiales bacterium]MCB9373150.1 NAD(+)/NADH kinase [Microthrixaceae bacterium]
MEPDRPDLPSTVRRPSLGRRAAAVVSPLLVLAVAAVTIAGILGDPLRFVVELALLAVLLVAAWEVLVRAGAARLLAVVVAVAALVGLAVSLVGAEGFRVASLVVRAVALLAAVGLGQHALGSTTRALARTETRGIPVPAARRGVLFLNLRSGGGKAEQHDLPAECRARGIEPVVLEPGQDWLEVVRTTAAQGFDVVGMAGGDGSQAMVGTVAAELGLPMVVVPAGTRNHLALDLGLDRTDVVGALDAYGDAVERTLDLADLNGRVFVNNVSLGVYAAIVRSPEYRDNKRDTTLATLPQVLGPGAEPFDLRFAGPDGTPWSGAHIVQVSNNPYGETLAGQTSRPRLDTGRLGVTALRLEQPGGPQAFLAALATGHPERYPGYGSWAVDAFVVDADGPVDVGLDGEAMSLDPPLRFSVRPAPVRVRLPRRAIGYSPAARAIGTAETLRELANVVRGRPTRFDH